MPQLPVQFGHWTLDTDDSDEAHDSWREVMNGSPLPWDVAANHRPGTNFTASLTRRSVSDLLLIDAVSDPVHTRRGPAQRSRDRDEFVVLLRVLEGTEVISHNDTSVMMKPGSLFVWDSTARVEADALTTLSKQALYVSRSALAEVGSRGDLPTGLIADERSATVNLLWNYLDSLTSTLDALPKSAHHAARNATIELLSAALRDRPTDSLGSAPAVRAAAERWIDHHLWSGPMNAASVAFGIKVSLRSLHRAFEGTEHSVASLIRARRLARARDELLCGQSVSQVAQRLHFADASHFSRAFKAHYGYSPREVRASASA